MKKNIFFVLAAIWSLSLMLTSTACQKTYTLGPLAVPTNTPVFTNSPTKTGTPTRTPSNTPTVTPTFTAGLTPPPMNIYCSSETAPLKTGSGSYGIHYATQMIPLCDGWMLYGDLTTNKIQAVNALYGIVGSSYQLSAVPGELAYDPTTGFLYAVLTGASFVAKVDLNNGTVTNIMLPAEGVHLAAANNGRFFVTLTTNYNWPNEYISYIDGNSNTVLSSFSMGSFNADAYIACSSAGTTLYVGADGCSNCTTYQFAFNTGTYALSTQFTASGTYTSNGEDMSISPDQNHLVWVNGGGNGGGYTIFDIFTTNINNTYGSFATGAYPTSAGFSPDSANIAATNGSDLQVFSVTTHAASKSTWVGAAPGVTCCPTNIYDLLKTRFSKGGGYVFGLDVPTYSNPAPSTIVWESFP